MPEMKKYVVTETREVTIHGSDEKAVLEVAVRSFRENKGVSSQSGIAYAPAPPKTVETNIKVAK